MTRLHDPDALRSGCAIVATGARFVQLDPDRIGPLATELITAGSLDDSGSVGDPWSVRSTDVERAIALVLTLDTINFGSGWHPVVRKRPGMSGATSMATAVREWERDEPITAARLVELELSDVLTIFDQPSDDAAVMELMVAFTGALVDLGRFVLDGHDGSFTDLVEWAGGSAVELASALTAMHTFDDAARWTGPDGTAIELHFDKRAQLVTADLHRTFGDHGPGRFDDLDRLTAFADNLVPHVLALDGVLHLDPQLRARIDREELLEPGSPEEVEIRALGVHGVELLRAELLARGHDVPSWQLDGILWRRGGASHYKAVPRHRTRSHHY